MAMLLAPYNNAMRLGMGFNSYTQQLCINDAVQKVGGIPASEKDLRRIQPDTGSGMSTTSTSAGQAGVLENPSGTAVIKRQDGQTDVSQVVTWTASFIENISDVTNRMNISGALSIQIDGMGGGGGAKAGAHFVDETKFKSSDLNYMIHVDVENQKLIADDVTQFVPIKNVLDSQFTDVYGDSFISGFLEGGSFNAIVHIKFEDKTALKNMGGELAINIDVKLAKITGSAEGEKKDESANTNHNTSINVSWAGGGDIKPDDVHDWTIETLKRVALEFPDKVAACPQRTSAILTKYTSLRSFHEQTIKGSPLDYENAGVYTSALLDAYMDYKVMWKQIQTMNWDYEHGITTIEAKESSQELKEYAGLLKDDYTTRQAKYIELTNSTENTSKAVVRSKREPEFTLVEPLPPNPGVPYKASVFGLDKARRDCRFEMIKIVREVDAVVQDPMVATDPTRNWQYLSPYIFKQLLPTAKVITDAPVTEDVEDLKKQLEDVQKAVETYKSREKSASSEVERLKQEKKDREDKQKLEAERQALDKKESKDREQRDGELKSTLEESQNTIKDLQSKLDEVAKAAAQRNPEMASQCGILTISTGDHNNHHEIKRMTFNPGLPIAPRMIYGINHLDSWSGADVSVQFDVERVTGNDFFARSRTMGNCHIYNLCANWLSLPEDPSRHFEYGYFDTSRIMRGPNDNVVEGCTFVRPFKKPPVVLCWIYAVDHSRSWLSLKTFASDINPGWFRLHIETWANRHFNSARICWLAYDEEENSRSVRTGQVSIRKDIPEKAEEINFSFGKKPATMIAVDYIDQNIDTNIRFSAEISEVSNNKASIKCRTWEDTIIDTVRFTWIAIE